MLRIRRKNSNFYLLRRKMQGSLSHGLSWCSSTPRILKSPRMFDLDQWQEIAATLSKNPLRTFLTALGVFWGIFMLVLMMGAGNGLERGATQEFSGSATNSFFVWAQRTTMPYKGMQPGRSIQLNQQDYEVLERRLGEAQYIAARNQLGGYRGDNLAIRGDKSGTFAISGDYPQIQHIEGLLIQQGRFLNPLDLQGHRKVAVIGRRVQELLFDRDEDPIGAYIRVGGVAFQVVGIFRMPVDGDQAERAEKHIYLPFTTFNRAFNFGNQVSWMAITSQPDVMVSEVEEKAIRILKQRHQVHPQDERALGHWNQQESYLRVKNVFIGIRFISWVVGLLTLLAGAIGISNIMLVIVKERTREIGVRRALGAKPWQIMQQIILESVVLTLVAGYGGLVFGLGLLEAISWAMDNFEMDSGMFGAPQVQVELAAVALLVLVVSGIFAGLIPALRAIRIRPVDALRAE